MCIRLQYCFVTVAAGACGTADKPVLRIRVMSMSARLSTNYATETTAPRALWLAITPSYNTQEQPDSDLHHLEAGWLFESLGMKPPANVHSADMFLRVFSPLN